MVETYNPALALLEFILEVLPKSPKFQCRIPKQSIGRKRINF